MDWAKRLTKKSGVVTTGEESFDHNTALFKEISGQVKAIEEALKKYEKAVTGK